MSKVHVCHPRIRITQTEKGSIFHIWVYMSQGGDDGHDLILYKETVKQDMLQDRVDLLTKIFHDMSKGVNSSRGSAVLVFLPKGDE